MCSLYKGNLGNFFALYYYLSEEKMSDGSGHFSLGSKDITEYHIRQTKSKITVWFILIESTL